MRLPHFLPAALIIAFAPGLLAAQDDAAASATGKQIAHIRLHGSLSEAPTVPDPLFGALSENFRAKLERIQKAAADKNVAALVVQIDGMDLGFAKAQELRQALAKFRKTGKKVYAYTENPTGKEYLVAGEADVLCMPRSGWFMVVGIRAEIMFFKDLLEKLGIRADFLQMGLFKSAAEPYTRNRLSDEARSQLKRVIDDFYDNSLVAGISASRTRAGRKDLTTKRVSQLIDEGPFTPEQALKHGLVDRLVYFEELEALIRKDLGREELKVARDYGKAKSQDIDLNNPFAMFRLLFSSGKKDEGTRKDRIAIVHALGPIVTGKSSSGLLMGETVGSTTLIEAIRKADADPKVRAIVLRVDSPGGSALASDLIWKALKDCKKPVVASMGDTAASGGYYISMAARKIYAQPGTLTGSIGVVGGKIALKGLFDKVGISTDVVARGANSGILASDDVWTKSERRAMETMMKDVYGLFLDKALAGRHAAGKKMTRKQLIDLAEGRVWTGRQALENGLIDALGSLEDAVAEAKVLGGLKADTEVDYLLLPKGRSLLDSLMEGDNPFGFSLGAKELARFPEMRDGIHQAASLLQLRQEPVHLLLPVGIRLR